jgi:hypothetical protein
VWPLDLIARSSRTKRLLHLGAHHVQAYTRENRQWALHRSVPIDAPSVAAWPSLERALQELMSDIDPSAAPVTVLLDSHWAPVCWVPAGQQPFSPQSFKALAQHRFSRIHGAGAQAWHIESNYLVGDSAALAFALPDALQSKLMASLGDTITLQPTLAHALESGHADVQPGVVQQALLEDDRMLVLTWQNSSLLGCHPALDVPNDPEACVKVLTVEQARLGLSPKLINDAASRAFVQSLWARAAWPQVSQLLKTSQGDVHWHSGLPGQGRQA